MNLGFYDGKIVNLDLPIVPLEDRGHQFGDGVYDVVVSYRGEYFALKEHLDRLERSCAKLELVPSYSRLEMEDICLNLLEKSEMKEAMLYLQWTRGNSPRSHIFPLNTKAVLSCTVRPRKVLDPEFFEKGVKAVLLPDQRWLRCDIKSLNLLGSVLAKQKASQEGCFEAILFREDKITEGSVSNSFCVRDGVIYTSPIGNLILSGITRSKVISIAKELDVPVKEEFVTPDFYRQADEVFLTGTTTEVMPIVNLDNTPIGNGKVGVITRKLQEAYSRIIGKF